MNPILSTEDKLDHQVSTIDWDCKDADTRYFTHDIHRYSGKFIPQIAAQVIKLISRENDIILDPYCGSGTTLLEAYLAKRRSVGVDLNPLACLISKVKTRPINMDAEAFLRKIGNDLSIFITDDLFLKINRSELAKDIKGDWRWEDHWYKKWFNDDRRLELIFIHQYISKVKNEELRNICLVAFSDILRSSSNAHSSYPNVMFHDKKQVTSPCVPKFLKRLEEIVHSVMTLNEVGGTLFPPEIYMHDNRKLSLETESIGAIVTHPPYIGSIPYAEYGVLSLKWLGYEPKEIDARLTGGLRQKKDVVDRFQLHFKEAIREFHRVLKTERHLFMLLGNPTVKGERVDLSRMAVDFATEVGFEVKSIQKRSGINRRANLMGEETLLFFQK